MGLRTNFKYEILTPTGFKPFYGVRRAERDGSLTLETTTASLTCSYGHLVHAQGGWKRADALEVGEKLAVVDGSDELTATKRVTGTHTFYEPIEVQGHAYVANGIINHNCEFLSSDALLINSIKLNQLQYREPLCTEMGFRFWVPLEELGGVNKTYLVSCDPSTGSGSDFSVIQVFDFPALNQIAEYRSNEVNIPLLYAKLKWVVKRLSEYTSRGRAEVLWTFERNGIGEALGALYANDEKQPEHAELFCDVPGKLGVFTSGKTKAVTCIQLKQLVEKTTSGMKINSNVLLFELKNFVAHGGSYGAKAGSTDDAVMATVGIIRLLARLSEWNEDAFKRVHEYVEPAEPDSFGDEPVPFIA